MIILFLLFPGLDKLSANFKELCADKESCDVTLKVRDKEFKAHRAVLIARCNVFAATFRHDTLEKQTGIITISDCDPDSFQEFLEYLYSGELGEISVGSALNLYYTSDKYDVEELKTFCVEYLMQCLAIENVCEIVMLADKYDETRLFTASQDFFNENVTKILLTSEWQRLMKNDYRLANKLLVEMSKVKLGD